MQGVQRHAYRTPEERGDAPDMLVCPAPPNGRKRMSLCQRAKIFVPFDPLEGFSAALAATELAYETQHRPETVDFEFVGEINGD